MEKKQIDADQQKREIREGWRFTAGELIGLLILAVASALYKYFAG